MEESLEDRPGAPGPILSDDAFLEAISTDPPPIPQLLEAVRRAVAEGSRERAVGWADLLQERLSGPSGRDAMMELLELRCHAGFDSPETLGRACQEGLRQVFADRKGQMLLRCAGLDAGLDPREMLRRLRVLVRLEPGRLCRDATWGLGLVRSLDDFDQKVGIDFIHRANHAMSYACAAERLELVSEDHFDARLWRDPEGLRSLARDKPGEVVKAALSSLGGLTVSELQKRLVPRVLSEDQWSEFWDRARAQLKSEGLVDIPARRSELMRLRTSPRRHDEVWFRDLSAERDLDRLADRLGEWVRAGNRLDRLPPEQRAVVTDRLSYLIRGSQGMRPDLLAAAVLLMDRLGGQPADVPGLAEAIPALRTAPVFLEAAGGLKGREVEALIAFLLRGDAEGTKRLLLSVLPAMKYSVLGPAISALLAAGAQEAVSSRLRDVLSRRPVPPAVAVWLAEHAEENLTRGLTGAYDLAVVSLEVLESKPGVAEGRRLQNLLRGCWERPEWLGPLMDRMSPAERRSVLRRVLEGRAWESTRRRAVVGTMLARDPELQAVMKNGDTTPPVAAGRWTSWRSYRERQRQLQHLVSVAIPQNSRDIAHARSYGDLRENFEYQAAKDQQKILLRRKEEWEADLRAVKGTDFKGFPTDRAGPGTAVTVCSADGRETTYCILGEWDRDEPLGIISNRSALAKALEGHVPGDEVTLPGPDGSVGVCRVVRVEGLPAAVRAWMDEDPVSSSM